MMTIKVRKEDGSLEKFHRSYIVESLETLGMDRDSAKLIAGQIPADKDITEHEIKARIFRMLDEMDPELAEKYLVTKKVHVKSESFQIRGNLLVPTKIMEYLELRNGDKVSVIHCKDNCVLRAYEKSNSDNEHDVVFMSPDDMKNIEIKKGKQVAICKHRPKLFTHE
jgi:hypothetical protein